VPREADLEVRIIRSVAARHASVAGYRESGVAVESRLATKKREEILRGRAQRARPREPSADPSWHDVPFAVMAGSEPGAHRGRQP